jgi:hypothetical protein
LAVAYHGDVPRRLLRLYDPSTGNCALTEDVTELDDRAVLERIRELERPPLLVREDWDDDDASVAS